MWGASSLISPPTQMSHMTTIPLLNTTRVGCRECSKSIRPEDSLRNVLFDSTFRFLNTKFGPSALHFHCRLHVYQRLSIKFPVWGTGSAFQSSLKTLTMKWNVFHCMKMNTCKGKKKSVWYNNTFTTEWCIWCIFDVLYHDILKLNCETVL